MTELEEWKKIIFTLPDHTFFDIVRNYLGDIKTPFNKHNLIERLGQFLTRPDTVKKILSLLDKRDIQVLSAVALVENCSLNHLYQLFSEDSYYNFYSHLLNLEERMLICSIRDNKKNSIIFLSPLFRKIIMEHVVNYDIVIQSHKISMTLGEKYPWYSTHSVCAFLSFILKNDDCLKNDMKFRRKYEHDIEKLLGNLDFGEFIKNIFLESHIITVKDGKVLLVVENIRLLENLDEKNFTLFILDKYLKSVDASLFLQILSTLKSDRCYDSISLRRIIQCCNIRDKNCSLPVSEVESIEKVLLQGGFVERLSDGFVPKAYYSTVETSRLVVQPSFSVYAEGNFSTGDSILLALCCDIMQMDRVFRYEITKASFIRGLFAGISRQRLIDFLEKKSGMPLPQNILFSFHSWESEYKSLTIYNGYVVQVDSRMTYILENNSLFMECVEKKLAGGVFFLKTNLYSKALKIMENMAQRKIALYETKKDNTLPLTFSGHIYEPLDLSLHNSFVCEKSTVDKTVLRDKILSMNVYSEQKEILLDRLNRKLILFDAQLDYGTARYEKNEVQGMDYIGKLHLCEQVISSGGYFLEIKMMDENERFMLRPIRIRRDGGEIILAGDGIPSGRREEIPLRKVGFLRKVRTSLID